jgi:hypothetical protein
MNPLFWWLLPLRWMSGNTVQVNLHFGAPPAPPEPDRKAIEDLDAGPLDPPRSS